MNTRALPTVPLASVTPGARLARDVPGADGQVLLAAGTVLTEGALEGLAARGIAQVALEPQHSAAELDAARDALRQRLAHLFRRCDLDDASGAARQLFDAVLERRLEELR